MAEEEDGGSSLASSSSTSSLASSSAGTVISHWSPLNMGICRAEVMSRNSSSMSPKRVTVPSARARSSMRTYHARSFSRFIGFRSSGGLA